MKDNRIQIQECTTAEVSTTVGHKPELPARVEAILSNGVKTSLNVTWDSIDPALYSQQGTFTAEGRLDPIDYPSPFILHRADPYLLKHTDSYYYFTGSVPEYDRIVLRRARTIAELPSAEEVVIWRKHLQGEMGNHIWAPELHYIDGAWYIYFAAGTAEDPWAIRHNCWPAADRTR